MTTLGGEAASATSRDTPSGTSASDGRSGMLTNVSGPPRPLAEDTGAALPPTREEAVVSVHPTPATVVDNSPDSATETALTFLRHHRDFMERERRTRLYFVRLARERGLSYQAIGEALGMTEAGVRKLLERGES